jgi:hypothetical protein
MGQSSVTEKGWSGKRDSDKTGAYEETDSVCSNSLRNGNGWLHGHDHHDDEHDNRKAEDLDGTPRSDDRQHADD